LGSFLSFLFFPSLFCPLSLFSHFSFFFVVLGFELKVSCLLGELSIACAMPTAYFAHVILERGSCSSYFMCPSVVGMTGACCHTQLLVEMGTHGLFAPAGLELEFF
jgi:hypothetical protein